MNKQPLTISFVIVLGIVLRFATAFLGSNYDFDSWVIVGDLASEASNFYCHTNRYNYGPIWGILLGGFTRLADLIGVPLRWFIVMFLTIADVIIYYLLSKTMSNKVGLLFFLNPISIMITGFHNQIDNVSIALVFIAVYQFMKNKNWYLLTLLLGLALVFKHAFIFFPLWLVFYLFHTKAPISKTIIPAFSLLVFLLAFLPFFECWQNIFTNVFKYYSRNNAPLYNILTFNFFNQYELTTKVYKGAFIVCITTFGFFASKKQSIFQLFVLYPLVLLVFSQSLTNQYLAIPIVALAILNNKYYYLYTLLGTLFLIFDSNGLNLGEKLFLNYNYQQIDLFFFSTVVVVLILCLFEAMKKNLPKSLLN